MSSRVSVVIATFNRAALVTAAIESALAQSDDVVVVDDASVDDTVAAVRPYRAAITFICNKTNRERGASRNIGARAARHRFIAFLDSDDVLLPGALERAEWAMLQSHGSPFVYSPARYEKLATGRVLEVGPAQSLFAPAKYDLSLRNPLSLSAVVVRRSSFEAAGEFSERRDLSGVEDWDLWYRLALHGEPRFVPEPGACIRIHIGNSTAASAEQLAALRRIQARILLSLKDDSELPPEGMVAASHGVTAVMVLVRNRGPWRLLQRLVTDLFRNGGMLNLPRYLWWYVSHHRKVLPRKLRRALG